MSQGKYKHCKYCDGVIDSVMEKPVMPDACVRCQKLLNAIANTPLKVLNRLVMDARQLRKKRNRQ